ncbi:MAG: 1,4-alpha-glucan branching protein GlgB [Burkholderiales bacterium]
MLTRDDINTLVHARHADPFAVLGMHEYQDALWVRTIQPGASRVEIIDTASGSVLANLGLVHTDGVFEGQLPSRRRYFPYRLRIRWGTTICEIEDPYRFPPVLGEMDVWLLAEGRHALIYEKLGVHSVTIDGVDGFAFAVWAPNASRVAIVGDFNHWDGRRHPMRCRRECGVWELFLPGLRAGARYKYEIKDAAGALLPLKADPFAFATELRPATASIVSTPPGKATARAAAGAEAALLPSAARKAPVSIYEVHSASWRRGENGRVLSWPELADRLLPYVSEMGFTHVEFMPVMEHPFDGSWGYQPTGLYAPTARHGSPADFAALVRRFHSAGIGVLLDWVPGHFPADAHALARFDGSCLYEHEDPRQGLHPDWTTLIYNYSRHEVRNYLSANALFWLERYAVAGLRVDAVASMLYLDYSRSPGEWVPNVHGGRENLDAVAFIRETNDLIGAGHPDAVVIAEESTAWPGVSRPGHEGGLGFHYKWNMGWMNDTMDYMQRDPAYRRHHHDALTFGLIYAFDENFILPLSHDEVVHGKGSLLAKMPGDRWQRFANLRLYFGFMWAHPGKKLLFMGGELGQQAEWNHDAELDWGALSDEHHRGVQRLVADLNRVYRDMPALHECDCEPRGFEWIDFTDRDQSVIVFLRRGRLDNAMVVVACNFTPVPREGYRIGVPRPGHYRVIINTDSAHYGGSSFGNASGVDAVAVPCHGREYSLTVTLPPLACVMFSWNAA